MYLLTCFLTFKDKSKLIISSCYVWEGGDKPHHQQLLDILTEIYEMWYV
jgi:hypothetical protein